MLGLALANSALGCDEPPVPKPATPGRHVSDADLGFVTLAPKDGRFQYVPLERVAAELPTKFTADLPRVGWRSGMGASPSRQQIRVGLIQGSAQMQGLMAKQLATAPGDPELEAYVAQSLLSGYGEHHCAWAASLLKEIHEAAKPPLWTAVATCDNDLAHALIDGVDAPPRATLDWYAWHGRAQQEVPPSLARAIEHYATSDDLLAMELSAVVLARYRSTQVASLLDALWLRFALRRTAGTDRSFDDMDLITVACAEGLAVEDSPCQPEHSPYQDPAVYGQDATFEALVRGGHSSANILARLEACIVNIPQLRERCLARAAGLDWAGAVSLAQRQAKHVAELDGASLLAAYPKPGALQAELKSIGLIGEPKPLSLSVLSIWSLLGLHRRFFSPGSADDGHPRGYDQVLYDSSLWAGDELKGVHFEEIPMFEGTAYVDSTYQLYAYMDGMRYGAKVTTYDVDANTSALLAFLNTLLHAKGSTWRYVELENEEDDGYYYTLIADQDALVAAHGRWFTVPGW